jgi:7-cyano-7-deazaguanine reductase
MTDTSYLHTLGASSTRYTFDQPDASLLEKFLSPFPSDSHTTQSNVHIEVPEFTSLCLHGDTLVDVARDELQHPEGIPLRDLVGYEGVVFSFDVDGCTPAARKFSNVRLTRKDAECVRVDFFLYKGPSHARRKEQRSIVCTPDHPFLVRTGWQQYQWVRADALSPDMQLVAAQTSGDTIRGKQKHRLVAEAIFDRYLESSELVHHIDHNHVNNSPDNLRLLDTSEHKSNHQSLRYGYDESLNTEELVSLYNSGRSVQSIADEFGCDHSTIKSRLAGRVELRSQSEQLIGQRSPAFTQMIEECKDFYVKGYSTYELGLFYGVHTTTISQWVEKAGGTLRTSLETKQLRSELEEELPALNHRVVAVAPSGNHDVFCMEVEGTENFFAAGVVVHNCPKTGQPDFAKIVIDYVPNAYCVESKSLKLYLMSYRMFGEFHESCVNRIRSDLVDLLDPHWLQVRGEFTPRGGIPFWPESSYYRPVQEEQ